MAKPTTESAQQQAARIAATLDDARESLGALMEAVPVDVEDSEEVYDWIVRPTLAFYVYGAMGSALESLDEARGHLRRAAGASRASVDREWRSYRAHRAQADRGHIGGKT